MLHIHVGYPHTFKGRKGFERVIWNVDDFFDSSVKPEWFNDSIAKEMVRDVDKSEVLSPYCIQSPVLGQIAPYFLSGGVKALLIMLNQDDVIVFATNCGDNCAKWIIEISKRKELTIILAHWMVFGSNDTPMKGIIENNGRQIETVGDYMNAMLDFAADNVI